MHRFRSIVPAAACAVTLSIASSSVTAAAQESPLTAIISQISQHEAEINRINLEIGALSEAVNQALVDLHDAQSLAEQARRGAEEARERLNGTQADVDQAQADLNEVSRSAYRSTTGGAPVEVDGDARKDALDRQSYLRKESEAKRATLEELQRARTQAANEESTLRQASRLADERATAAEEAETHARETLQNSMSSLGEQVALRDAAVGELAAAQAALVEIRPEAAPVPVTEDAPAEQTPVEESAAETPVEEIQATPETEQAEESTPEESTTEEEAPVAGETEAPEAVESAEATESTEDATEDATEESTEEAAEAAEDTAEETADEAAEEPAEEAAAEEAAPEAPTLPSLEDFSNPEAVEAAVTAFAEAVGQTQADHGSLENPYAGDEDGEGIASTSSSEDADAAVAETDAEQNTNVADVLPEVKDSKAVTEELRGDTTTVSDQSRQDQIEAVIARAESQIGTPYVWGGGNANGPTTGINDGVNKSTGQAGYDCSGLVLYAYSGAGIDLPHYTGYQYQRGTQIPVAQAERGDLLFWGAGGSQHVAIYLGDGMMLESPQTGMNVQKTPVRHNGLAPYAVRLI